MVDRATRLGDPVSSRSMVTRSSLAWARSGVVMSFILAACVGLLSACGATRSGGPLVFSTDETHVCVPLARFADAAFGIILPSDLPEGIVLSAVEPVGVSGVNVAGVYVMPAADSTRLLVDSFPPVDQTPNSWKRAVPALGAKLPTDGPYDLVVEVRADEGGGKFDGMRLTYSFAGSDFDVVSHVGLTVSPRPCAAQ